MNKLSIVALLTISATSNASNWTGGLSYGDFSSENDGQAIELPGLTGSIGYEVDFGNGFSIMPQYSITQEMGNDTIDGGLFKMDVEIESIKEVGIRGQYDFNNNVYVFARYSKADLELVGSIGNVSATFEEKQTGKTYGIGYIVSKNIGLEISSKKYDKIDVLEFGVKFNF